MIRRNHIVCIVLLGFVLPMCACAGVPDSAQRESSAPGRVTVSRLCAEAELARYANYYASSFSVRELGRRMGVRIAQRAACQYVLSTDVMNRSDRQVVRRLESCHGDDFDKAYIDLLRSEWNALK